MAKRTPGIEQVNTILPKSIHALGPKVEKLYRCHFVLWHWFNIVGETIAAHVHPMGIEHGRLWLYSMDSSWRNEIQMMQTEILQKVNRYAGECLVTEMRFGRKWEKPELQGIVQDEEYNEETLKRDIIKENLTDDEMECMKKECSSVEDEELAEHLYYLMIRQKKLMKWKESQSWHPCPDCGTLCPREEERCNVCDRRHRSEVRAKVRHILQEIPWMRYGEIRKQVQESTPYMVNSLRASMVQEMAKTVDFGDFESMAAKRLVMLHRCLPPEQLTEEVMRRTLYYLRKDLSKPREFRTVKRYDYIPRGRRKAGGTHVSPSGK